MWWKVIIVLLVTEISLSGQDRYGVAEILNFLGAEHPEEVNEEEVERLADYFQRPLKINQATLDRLVDSGLMDRYKAMSLVDYRARHGDVLSKVELSLVDGFGESFVQTLLPFISFESAMLPGQRKRDKYLWDTDLHFKGGMKYSDGSQWMSGVKSKFEYGDRMAASLAINSPYGQFSPDKFNYSASMLLRFPRIHTRLVLGDFNARFGQGLLLWNGLSLSSLSSPSAFMKNPVGLSLSSSYTGNYAFTGIGFESNFGKYVMSAILALPDIKNRSDVSLMPALNIARYTRHGHIAMTHYSRISGFYPGRPRDILHRSSADTRWCIRGVDIFGECAYDWDSHKAAALVGTIFPAGEALKFSTMLRYYPASFNSDYSGAVYSVSSASNEYSISMSSELNVSRNHRFVLTLDGAHLPTEKKNDRGGSMQFKGLFTWQGTVTEWLSMKLRVTERYRTWSEAFRTDLRLDLLSEFGDFRLNTRLNSLSCSAWGFLSYMEGGYDHGQIALWLRQGIFIIDDWDDRIYAYERSAPGSFKVPAYYGRGLWTAFTMSSKLSALCKLYLRAAYTAYPFMSAEKRKPGKAELELYSIFSF